MNNKVVVFFTIKTPEDKLSKLVQAAHFHFSKKEKLLFFVKDDMTAKFVDDLLWKIPEESCLPHGIEDFSYTVIISKDLPVTLPSYVFNLTIEPLLSASCKRIYELEDTSSPQKKEISQKKFYAYKEKGFLIESR
ncbi:MAG: DNA polymerase III subunit chi [Chlamydiota bacterium]